jgi:hypothetical protein
MSLNSHNSLGNSDSGFDRSGLEIDGASTGEDTLRLIAGLAAPEGLEERVRVTLRTAPRHGRVLAWPLALRADATWVRASAAAAIVMIVVGGGWGVYSHIKPWQQAKAPLAPARVGTMSGFSGASAVRSPQTLQPPVVSAPPKSAQPHQSQKKTHKKGAALTAQTRTTMPAAK